MRQVKDVQNLIPEMVGVTHLPPFAEASRQRSSGEPANSPPPQVSRSPWNESDEQAISALQRLALAQAQARLRESKPPAPPSKVYIDASAFTYVAMSEPVDTEWKFDPETIRSVVGTMVLRNYLDPKSSAISSIPGAIIDLRLLRAELVAARFRTFLNRLATESHMAIRNTTISRYTFVSDGIRRVVVCQYLEHTPAEVVEYADSVSNRIDAWIDELPEAERLAFDDDIVMDFRWATNGNR